MTGPVAILIPAAGASRRMQGRDKLLEPVAGGQALLAERIATARATGQQVLVALPPREVAPRRWAQVSGAQIVEIGAQPPGMGASLAGLARALPETAKGALILPADMPDITVSDLNTILQAFDNTVILRGAGEDGTAGHPVLFPAASFAGLRQLGGDQGARSLLQGADLRLVPLPGRHALTDLDTPGEWQAWRARHRRA